MRTTLAERGTRPRLCFLSYKHLSRFAMTVLDEYADRADIEVVNASFDGALDAARERIRDESADAFISAGANATILRSAVQAPVATIKLSGFDILLALLSARRISARVGVVMYGQSIPELEAIRDLLRIEVAQYAYRTPDEARRCFELLVRDGYEVVVGSSLVVEFAEQYGLQGRLAYSLGAVRQGIEDAIELARVARLEAGRYEQLNGVLHNLQEAVLAVDRDNRVIAVNPPMEKLLGRVRARLLGQHLEDIEPALSLQATLESGQQERGGVMRHAQRDWIVNRTPIREHGETVGAAITLYDARSIQDADASLRSQQRRYQPTARYRFGNLIGHSPAFVRACESAKRFARTDLTVLLSGESGVGKELFAQAIHNDSKRAGKPFVAVNCAAFPEALLESELFGYEEGAFTGSRRGGKRGLFEAAHTGTLFLDEIGDMPVSLQTRLLRVLQEREIVRLGGAVPIPVDVRIIAATHQPLPQLIAARQFRQDLYYRINTLQLALPPLRERQADIEALAVVLLRRSLDRVDCALDAAALVARVRDRLVAYPWPGNVRELENLCERMAVFFSQWEHIGEIAFDALRHDCPELYAAGMGTPPGHPSDDRARVLDVLAACGGNRQQAAQRLGISRATLWRWIKEARGAPAPER
ncbi:propionate catabolism operon regulatory protein PrpR [Cupriavidus respiraculi]|uniref:propionate catabolism operon regulatory protein PrpR n=1 Tax=Cupriavidus respiraculi TaxID=195930 RepID=UPI001C98E133|nr:propionate catabolism operon regulatory protein PrpR [Cupriavidus respiraculi]MBY4948035.1 propionate catabolism operon regulatory protein PrpR [Cupriavidus respiraculi]